LTDADEWISNMPVIASLTATQRKIFRFIEGEAAHGTPPTLRGIQAAFGLKAIGTVQDHIRALIKKGFSKKIRARPGASVWPNAIARQQ